MSNDLSNILNEFYKAANGCNLQCLIIGGLAASYWGTPRFTGDIDLVVENNSYKLAEQVMGGLGYSSVFVHPKQSFAHYKPTAGSGIRIDFMMVDANTWEQLAAEQVEVEMGGDRPFPMVGAKHLIAMKMHSAKQPDRRDSFQDLSDIAEILIAQDKDFKDNEISAIIEKHGTEETISKLKEIYESKRQK